MIATQTSAMSGAAPISELRPRLRRDIAYVPGDRGIVFRSADTVFSINGAGTYELLSKLLPRLDGTRTVGEMCGHLPTGQADVVARLIAALYERDVLRNVVSEPALLTPAQERRFAAQIGFLEHYRDTPRTRFAAFANSRILVCGTPSAGSELIAALARNGATAMQVDLGGALEPGARAEMARLEAEGVHVTLSTRDRVMEPGSVDYVVGCWDTVSVKDVADLEQAAHRAGATFLSAIILGAEAYLGPLSSDGRTGCVLCLLLRVAGNAAADRRIAILRSLALGTPLVPDQDGTFAPGRRILANNVAFEVFKRATGLATLETDGGVIVHSLTTLESTRVQMASHPDCPRCGPAAASWPAHDDAPADDAEAATRAALTALHPYGG